MVEGRKRAVNIRMRSAAPASATRLELPNSESDGGISVTGLAAPKAHASAALQENRIERQLDDDRSWRGGDGAGGGDAGDGVSSGSEECDHGWGHGDEDGGTPAAGALPDALPLLLSGVVSLLLLRRRQRRV